MKKKSGANIVLYDVYAQNLIIYYSKKTSVGGLNIQDLPPPPPAAATPHPK